MASYQQYVQCNAEQYCNIGKKKKVTSVVSKDYILWIQADSTAGNTLVSLERGQMLQLKPFPFVNLWMSPPPLITLR